MGKNIFNQKTLELIQGEVGKNHRVARSRTFTKAVVVGRPGLPGCVMVSEISDTKSGFLASFFPDHDPKSVADGMVDFYHSYTEEFSSFFTFLLFVKKVTSYLYDLDKVYK